MTSVLRAGQSLLPACAVAGAAYAYLRNTDTVSVAFGRWPSHATVITRTSDQSSNQSDRLCSQALFSTAQADVATSSGGLNPNDWIDLKLIEKKKLTHNTVALR